MKVAITGASGFIGTKLVQHFESRGYQCLKIRSFRDHNIDNKTQFCVDDLDNPKIISQFEDCKYFINLAGLSLAQNIFWSKKIRQDIYNSRINTTKKLVRLLNRLDGERKLISTSAVGFYPSFGIDLDEESNPGKGFLSNLCVDWEQEALKCKHQVVIARLAIVLDMSGGIFLLFKLMTKFFVLLLPYGGNNFMPWISRDDVVGAISFLMESKEIGVFNFVAPQKMTFENILKLIAKYYKRNLVIFKFPKKIIEIVLKEKSRLIMDDQSVIPKRLLQLKYNFIYKNFSDLLNGGDDE